MPEDIQPDTNPEGSVIKPTNPDEPIKYLWTGNLHSFDLVYPKSIPKDGTIKVDFDTDRLSLKSASINDEYIVWSFVPIEPRDGVITVTIHGGILRYLKQIEFKVKMVYLHPWGPGPSGPFVPDRVFEDAKSRDDDKLETLAER